MRRHTRLRAAPGAPNDPTTLILKQRNGISMDSITTVTAARWMTTSAPRGTQADRFPTVKSPRTNSNCDGRRGARWPATGFIQHQHRSRRASTGGARYWSRLKPAPTVIQKFHRMLCGVNWGIVNTGQRRREFRFCRVPAYFRRYRKFPASGNYLSHLLLLFFSPRCFFWGGFFFVFLFVFFCVEEDKSRCWKFPIYRAKYAGNCDKSKIPCVSRVVTDPTIDPQRARL